MLSLSLEDSSPRSLCGMFLLPSSLWLSGISSEEPSLIEGITCPPFTFHHCVLLSLQTLPLSEVILLSTTPPPP